MQWYGRLAVKCSRLVVVFLHIMFILDVHVKHRMRQLASIVTNIIKKFVEYHHYLNADVSRPR